MWYSSLELEGEFYFRVESHAFHGLGVIWTRIYICKYLIIFINETN